MNTSFHLTTATLALAVFNVSAATLYVSLESANPVPPYATWETAASVIQDAVDAANAGDTVFVTNGLYSAGGRDGNRVLITNSIRLESVNGPSVTTIDGGGSVRCASLTTNAVVSGFTLTQGAAEYGGGVRCASTNAVLTNCAVTGNSASWGGGASGGTLHNCTLTGNSAWIGGAASGGTLYNCTLTGNSAQRGGGVYYCTLNNCTLTGNSAKYDGGGAAGGTLYNCIVYFNRPANYSEGTVFTNSCTTPLPPGPGNTSLDPLLATVSHLSSLSPCIGAGHPDYASGVDIDGERWRSPPSMGADDVVPGSVSGPLSMRIVSAYTRCSQDFPALFTADNTGSIAQSVWDFGDGTVVTNQAYATHAWSTPGVYAVRLTGYNESHPEGVSTSLEVTVTDEVHYVNLASPNPVFPYTSWHTAATSIQDAVDAAMPGDTVLVTNGVYAVGSRGAYPEGGEWNLSRVVVTNSILVKSVNGPLVTEVQGANWQGQMRCVYLGPHAVLSGFTLARGFADAYDYGGGVFCEPSAVVTNCILRGNTVLGTHGSGLPGAGAGAYGGTLYNCTLDGNYPSDTLPSGGSGGGAAGCILYSCVLTGNFAARGGGAFACTLYNCTLTGNLGEEGGGAFACTLYNCTLTGNSAYYGGGAYAGMLYNCTVSGDSAYLRGGGAYAADALYNCTVTGNSAAESGGGVCGGSLYNSIVYYNTAPVGSNHFTGPDPWTGYELSTELAYCCTTPLPTNGVGNIDADPLLINLAAGDLRLRPDSPCIDAGTNLTDLLTTDLIGLPRVMDGNNDGVARVDMGAHEFNPYRFEPALHLSPEGFRFTVRGEPGKNVRIERSSDLLHWEFAGQVPIPASGQTLIDPAATAEPFLFYRAVSVP